MWSAFYHSATTCCEHTHTQPFNGPFSRTTRVSQYQKGKTNLDFTEARDGEWQWNQLGHMQVCTLLQTDNHTSTPSLCFLQAGCPSCRPTKSVKALKALLWTHDQEMSMIAMPQCYAKLSEGLLWLGSYLLCLVKESTAHVLVSFFSFLLQTGLHVSVRDELHWLCIVQLNVFCWIM